MKKFLTTLILLVLSAQGAFANVGPSAAQVTTNCSTWNKNLNCTMTNQQLVDNAVDQLSGGSGSGTVTNIATTSPLTGGPITTTGTLGISQATASTNGYLSSANWTTFNGKQANMSLLPGTYVNGDICTYASSGTVLNCNTSSVVMRTVSVSYGTPGSGNVVPTGIVGYTQVPFSGTIVGYALAADQSGSIVVDVWKTNAGVPTSGNSITASARPTLSSAQYINSTTLTGWTTSVAANDVFGFNVVSASTIDSYSLILFISTSA